MKTKIIVYGIILIFYALLILICCTRPRDMYHNLPLKEVTGKDTIMDSNYYKSIKGDDDMLREYDKRFYIY